MDYIGIQKCDSHYASYCIKSRGQNVLSSHCVYFKGTAISGHMEVDTDTM